MTCREAALFKSIRTFTLKGIKGCEPVEPNVQKCVACVNTVAERSSGQEDRAGLEQSIHILALSLSLSPFPSLAVVLLKFSQLEVLLKHTVRKINQNIKK